MTQSENLSSSIDAGARRTQPVFGRWQTVELLHDGEWIQVFVARPVGCPRNWPSDYIVKAVKPQIDGESVALELLRREVHVAQSVTHPHLISILTARLDEPPYYMVMPFLPGQSLAKMLSPDQPLRLPLALWIVRQIAEALDAMHAQDWVHGDIKPSNIIIAPQGHATLIDLGFASKASADRHNSEPLMATPYYTAPERLTGANIHGHCDVYSLGVVLYELLTGRLPFAAAEPYDLAVAHLQEKPPEPRRFNAHIPPRVVRLVRRMLAKQALRRPRSNELVALLVELEVDAFDQWAA